MQRLVNYNIAVNKQVEKEEESKLTEPHCQGKRYNPYVPKVHGLKAQSCTVPPRPWKLVERVIRQTIAWTCGRNPRKASRGGVILDQIQYHHPWHGRRGIPASRYSCQPTCEYDRGRGQRFPVVFLIVKKGWNYC